METVIKNWGNSHGIRIPLEYMKAMDITTNTPLEMYISDNHIIISKKNKHKTLKERVQQSGIPLKAYDEYDWGEPKGDEVW